MLHKCTPDLTVCSEKPVLVRPRQSGAGRRQFAVDLWQSAAVRRLDARPQLPRRRRRTDGRRPGCRPRRTRPLRNVGRQRVAHEGHTGDDSLVVSVLDQRPRGRGFESRWLRAVA